MLSVECNSNGGTPRVIITGDNLEVKAQIEKVFGVYPPQSYNTRIEHIEILTATTLRAVVTHWASSD